MRNEVIFLCRGKNPFILRVSDELKKEGWNAHLKTIETKETNRFFDPEETKKLIFETISGMTDNVTIATDSALYSLTADLFKSRKVVNAYDIFEWPNESVYLCGGMPDSFIKMEKIVGHVSPIVYEIKQKGKEPVVVGENIDDHMNFKKIDEGEKNILKEFNKDKEWQYTYSAILNIKLGIPVIYRLKKNCVDSVGVPIDKVVLLVDHHVFRNNHKEVLDIFGVTKFPAVLICPCCIGIHGSSYLNDLVEKGFNQFPLGYEQDTKNVLERLKLII